jgi:predicted AAA+ superfamily ATPase
MYIRREIEQTIDRMLKQGKVVLVTGARQVGKTTMLRHHLGESYGYVTMDDPAALLQATQDALLFFRSHELPLIIDEVQKAPQLFSTVKYLVDQSDAKGTVVLTGSQTYHLMKGVSESLAGRIRIIKMAGLSLREITMVADTPRAYVPRELKAADVSSAPRNIWSIIHRGSMPELQDHDIEWDAFYTDYERAYLERDVRELINIKDEARFYSFMVACAARTGQLFSASDVAKTVSIDYKTAQSWMSVLEASSIVHLLKPFWSNMEKRLTKTPKIFFTDTGLACHLTRWTTPDQLERGAAAGHMFETFVVSEVMKSHMNAGANLHDVWFYRDARKREIDLVIQQGRTLHPVEVKSAATVGKDAIGNFGCLEGMTDYEVGFGHVVCQVESPYLISESVQAVPAWAI